MSAIKLLRQYCWRSKKYLFLTHQRHLSDTAASKGPLSGIRVLDMTRILAGPFCTMLLGDLGAEIIKIEKPGTGDETRLWGPPFVGDQSCYFLSINRNKKSVAVNVKSSKGLEIIKKIAKTSDVFIENYVPGQMKKMGLDFESLHAVAPKLIYLSLTGYGSEGPYRDRAGYDVIVASMAGLMHITGPETGEPCKVGVAMTDLATGLYAKGAILTALLERHKTGRGQKLDIDLMSTQVSMLVNVASSYLNGGVEGRRMGTAHQSIVPYKAFQTKCDGYITVGGASEKQYQIICKIIEMNDLITDERFKTNKDRVKNRNILEQILEKRFKELTLSEWLRRFEGSNIPYGPVNSIKDVFNDPHVQPMIKTLKHSTAGMVKVVGPAVKFNESSNCVRSAPPTLGQDTTQVLREFYSDSEIDELYKQNIIQ